MFFAIAQRLDHGLTVIERGIVVVLIACIALVTMAQVILRYVFSAPLFWAEEIAVQMLVTAAMFGLSLLVQQGQLVAINFLPQALPPKLRHLLMFLTGLILCALFVFLAWLGWNWIANPITRLELAPTTQMPRWYTYATLPLAMSLMALHQAVRSVHEAASVFGGEQ